MTRNNHHIVAKCGYRILHPRMDVCLREPKDIFTDTGEDIKKETSAHSVRTEKKNDALAHLEFVFYLFMDHGGSRRGSN